MRQRDSPDGSGMLASLSGEGRESFREVAGVSINVAAGGLQ